MRRFILILAVLFCVSCEMQKGETILLTVLSDRTDPVILKPDMATLEGFLGLDKNPNRGVEFKFKTIGDVDFLPIKSLNLKQSSLLDNNFQRTTDVSLFINKVDTLLVQENQNEYSFQSSSIFRPVLDELVKAKNSRATHKVVILYSDLQEISDLYNTAGFKERKDLLENPDLVAGQLVSHLDIPNLKGVRLHILYYPSTREENRTFRAMFEVYKIIFKDTGLELQIGSAH